MSDTPKRPKRPADFNQRAYQVFQEAIGEAPAQVPDEDAKPPVKPPKPGGEKDPAAVELGKRGGRKGGLRRAALLSPERRREIAKLAALRRWGQPKEKAQPAAEEDQKRTSKGGTGSSRT